MKRFLAIACITFLAPLSVLAQSATMYKSPYCGCCLSHADYLRDHGFEVEIVEQEPEALATLKQEHAIPQRHHSCHTLLVEGYVVEGHVPVEAIEHLLAKRPDITGITLPGMPAGSPGMNGEKTGPFKILVIGNDGRVFMEI